jgi:NAD(P)-dependent dehydrogenase (short-subunit alcohol dehydrogenase family)
MTALDGKVAVVTGAASGIGRAVATRFVAEGAVVFGFDRDAVGLETLNGVSGVVVDISDESSVSAAFERVTWEAGPLDVIVANAGVQLIGEDAAIADLDLDVWQRTLSINLTGTFLTLKHAVRGMTRGGSVIVTGSPTALTGVGSDFAAYSSSKGGVHALTRAVAQAYARDGIRANIVVPGHTLTPLVEAIADDPKLTEELLALIPLGRRGATADVEGIMVYLASDESAYATGATFTVDGGMTTL